jgi:hypothetical protein
MCNETLSLSLSPSFPFSFTHTHTHTHTHTKEVFLESNVTDPKEQVEISFHLTMTAATASHKFSFNKIRNMKRCSVFVWFKNSVILEAKRG